jgi:hypothetical protein
VAGVFAIGVTAVTTVAACLVQLKSDTNSMFIASPGAPRKKIAFLCAMDASVAGVVAFAAQQLSLADGLFAWMALGATIPRVMGSSGTIPLLARRIDLRVLLEWRKALREAISDDLSTADADQIESLVTLALNEGVSPATIGQRMKSVIEGIGPGFLEQEEKMRRCARIDDVVESNPADQAAVRRLLRLAFKWRMRSLVKSLQDDGF